MKKILILSLSILLFNCSSNKYLLSDRSYKKNELKNFISKLINEGKIEKNPVILLNEKVLTKKEIKNIKILSSDISKMSVIKKGNTQMVEVYGKKSLNGIVLVETKSKDFRYRHSSNKSKILYIVDGKIISVDKLKKLDKNKIDSLTVIKDKKEVSKYTEKEYDGIIIIVMKKPEHPTKN
jgi:hypothetical protein